ncbi:hypothetical protein B0H19DRAFT_1073465 [Mycena capillaripes]|nr:hypothetical protein B0H19DRAFT_1073465 [Mycena capillaripes]
MDHSSPLRPPRISRSRPSTYATGARDDEGEEYPQAAATPGHVNRNLTAAMQRDAAKKRLRPDQKADLDVFMADSPALREAKLYAQGFHLENLVMKIVVATPPWELSDELIKNIYSYAAAVLLSPKLSAYKGNIPKNVLFAILRQYRFDLPPGVEHNPANWAKVKKAIEAAFTQLRSKFKKAIASSLKTSAKDKSPAPKSQQKNIFELTQIMVEGTQCEVNVLLCARVAVMRKNYIKDPSVEFWDTVDRDLVKIRKKADGDADKLSRAFRHILKKDRAAHGIDNYQIDETVDALQQEVDNIVDATSANANAVTPEDDAEGGEDELIDT